MEYESFKETSYGISCCQEHGLDSPRTSLPSIRFLKLDFFFMFSFPLLHLSRLKSMVSVTVNKLSPLAAISPPLLAITSIILPRFATLEQRLRVVHDGTETQAVSMYHSAVLCTPASLPETSNSHNTVPNLIGFIPPSCPVYSTEAVFVTVPP